MLKFCGRYSKRLLNLRKVPQTHHFGARNVHSGPQSRPASYRLATSVSLFVGGIIAGGLLATGGKNVGASSCDSSTLPVSKLETTKYASKHEVEAAIEDIKKIVGKDNVDTLTDSLSSHADSSWQTRHARENEMPSAVIYPTTTKDVSEVMKIANSKKIPVTAFCGGTSLEGHFTPVYGGLTLDMSNMDKILEVHENDLDVVVQPGVGWEDLNDTLRDRGLMFGADAGPGARISGMVNTGASGINAFFYGPMRHNVINLTVVMADGTVVKTKRRARKSSAGYNLAELFINSEGTLGIVTEITLRLYPVPKCTKVGLLTFPSISDATDTVQEMLKTGIPLNALELMDDETMRIINASGSTDRKWEESHTLLLRFAGPTDDVVNSSIQQARMIAKKHRSINLTFATNADDSADLWSARKNALWSLEGAYPGNEIWTCDVAVPFSNLSEIIMDAKNYVTEAGIESINVGHVGDGNFHLIMSYDGKTQKKTVQEIAEKLVLRAIELDGTCTGEHGIGAGKRHYLVEEVGPDTIALMRQIKHALDPNTILNPGKVFQTSVDDTVDHV